MVQLGAAVPAPSFLPTQRVERTLARCSGRYRNRVAGYEFPPGSPELRRQIARRMDGCRLFTNKLCNYGLFFNDDFKKPLFDSINNVLTINSSLLKVGIQPLWLIVPDKSTVYLNENPSITIWNTLAQYPELSAPNLSELFIRQSKLIKDFYKPNDTHLSVNGFLYLGDIVAERLQR